MIPRGRLAGSLVLMLVAVPLVVPWNLIPMIWLNLLHPTYGTVAQLFDAIGFDFDYKFNAVYTYALLVTVDTWHWIGLVVILAYSGLSAIPPSYYQAARIDGASRAQVFWHIQLPKIRPVLLMALLLRVIDSLMIYVEAFGINAGGPMGATAFLSLELGEINAFNYGPPPRVGAVFPAGAQRGVAVPRYHAARDAMTARGLYARWPFWRWQCSSSGRWFRRSCSA